MVDDPAPAYRQVEELTKPVVVSGRSHAGFNPATESDVKLFAAVLDGNNLVRGFRNAEIRERSTNRPRMPRSGDARVWPWAGC